MTVLAWGMIDAGIVALVAGLVLARQRYSTAIGSRRTIVLGPVYEAAALAMFAAEHVLAAKDLSPIVPPWLPYPLFWTYFVGAAWLAAAISLIAWRCVSWSAPLLALMFLIIVATIDLPLLPQSIHDRLFWTLTVREMCFSGGAMVLAGSQWPRERMSGKVLIFVGRLIVACTFIFYGIEHFFFPRNVPGVPLEKMTPSWVPTPTLLACFVGTTLLIAGIEILIPRSHRFAAAYAGTVLLALTIFFYVPIFLTEVNSPLALEGLNYVGDTLLFAGTAYLVGFDQESSGAELNPR
jgi:uncharacterized membrane protein